MPRISVFADESGNFDFSAKKGASRYFILTTIACPDFSVGDAIADLLKPFELLNVIVVEMLPH